MVTVHVFDVCACWKKETPTVPRPDCGMAYATRPARPLMLNKYTRVVVPLGVTAFHAPPVPLVPCVTVRALAAVVTPMVGVGGRGDGARVVSAATRTGGKGQGSSAVVRSLAGSVRESGRDDENQETTRPCYRAKSLTATKLGLARVPPLPYALLH